MTQPLHSVFLEHLNQLVMWAAEWETSAVVERLPGDDGFNNNP